MADAVPVTEQHVSKYDLGGAYLRGVDLLSNGAFKTLELTIEEFYPAGSLNSADGKKVDKPCISFVGKIKKLVLNATNQELLHLITGQSNGMMTKGYKVKLEARLVEAFGDICLGIRLIPDRYTLLRKGVRKRMGQKAEWVGQAKSGAEIPVTGIDRPVDSTGAAP